MKAEESQIQFEKDGSITVLFDLGVYTATAIKKAAYKFAPDFSVLFSSVSENSLKAQLCFPKIESDVKEGLVRAFLNEVLDQDLRERIAIETEGTRNLILAQAFSKTNLLSEE